MTPTTAVVRLVFDIGRATADLEIVPFEASGFYFGLGGASLVHVGLTAESGRAWGLDSHRSRPKKETMRPPPGAPLGLAKDLLNGIDPPRPPEMLVFPDSAEQTGEIRDLFEIGWLMEAMLGRLGSRFRPRPGRCWAMPSRRRWPRRGRVDQAGPSKEPSPGGGWKPTLNSRRSLSRSASSPPRMRCAMKP